MQFFLYCCYFVPLYTLKSKQNIVLHTIVMHKSSQARPTPIDGRLILAKQLLCSTIRTTDCTAVNWLKRKQMKAQLH